MPKNIHCRRHETLPAKPDQGCTMPTENPSTHQPSQLPGHPPLLFRRPHPLAPLCRSPLFSPVALPLLNAAQQVEKARFRGENRAIFSQSREETGRKRGDSGGAKGALFSDPIGLNHCQCSTPKPAREKPNYTARKTTKSAPVSFRHGHRDLVLRRPLAPGHSHSPSQHFALQNLRSPARSVVCRLRAGYVLIVCRLVVGHVLVMCRFMVGYESVLNNPTTPPPNLKPMQKNQL